MPIAAAEIYDDEDDVKTSPAKKNNVAPKINDTEAFPDAGWGSGSGSAAPTGGKSFASLASEVLPEQKGGIDTDKPIIVKMPRPVVKARIVKVREAYKRDGSKKMGAFKLFHDEGMPAGVPEKKAEMDMSQIGDVISTISDFQRSWREVEKMPQDEGTNIRLFKAEFDTPSPDNNMLEKGGKYQLRVNKTLSSDMYEELCTYLMDNRLDNAVVGVCMCIRAGFDLIQLWTKNASSNATVEVFCSKLQLLLGSRADVTYARFSDVFGKASKQRKFYLIESLPGHDHGVAMTVDNIVQMREFGSKKDKKKGGADGFTEVSNFTDKKKDRTDEPKRSPLMQAEEAGVAHVDNYGLLAGEEDDNTSGTIGEDVQLFAKKKTDKGSRKGSTKKGSKKERKADNFEFDALATSQPLIPQQVFVGAGLGGVLFVVLLAIFMSGALN